LIKAIATGSVPDLVTLDNPVSPVSLRKARCSI